MKTHTVYVEIPCSEGTTEILEKVFTNCGVASFDGEDWSDVHGYLCRPEWWLEKREDQVVLSKEELDKEKLDFAQWANDLLILKDNTDAKTTQL